jgi:undecaprenyl-diphosphatase
MRKPLGLYRRWLILLLVGPGLVLGSYLGYIHEQGNFHIVAPDRMYRSRQLDKAELIHYITTYQIKSILNLRGENTGSEWYQDEIRVEHELGVTHHDYGISANRDVLDEDLNAIMIILRNAPKPILIHCKSGADRTGLIAALYQYVQEGRSAEEAASQLSIVYGHLPFFWNSTAAMDRTFWRYVSMHASTGERTHAHDRLWTSS